MNSKDDIGPIVTSWDDRAVEHQVDQAIAAGRTTVRLASMKLGPYNGYSGEVRVQADRKIKVAIELGLIPPSRQCSVCGETKGRIDYHAENYGRPLLVAAICQKCHMALHNRFRSSGYAASWQKRIKPHADGTKWFEQLRVAGGTHVKTCILG